MGWSCGVLPWWCPGFGCLAAQKGFDNDHGTAAFRARLVRGLNIAFGAGCLIRRLIGLCIQQAPDLRDPVATVAVSQKARVSDAMETGGQDVDQEPADELGRQQSHRLHAVCALDAIVFPSKGNSAGIRTDEPMVGDCDPVRITAQVGQHRFRPAEGWLGALRDLSFMSYKRLPSVTAKDLQHLLRF